MAKEPDAKGFIEAIAGEFKSLHEKLDKLEKRLPETPKKEEVPTVPEPKTFWESLFGGGE